MFARVCLCCYLSHQLFGLTSYLASAFVFVGRATTDPALAALANVPSACQSTCTVLTALANVDPNNLATLSTVCTPQVSQAFLDCITCFEANSPQTFTPTLLTELQSDADQLETGCLVVGVSDFHLLDIACLYTDKTLSNRVPCPPSPYHNQREVPLLLVLEPLSLLLRPVQ